MTTHEHPRSAAKKAEALELLLGGATVSAVAVFVGVRRETVGRWRSEPRFQEEFAERRDEIKDAAHARLLSMVIGSIDMLYQVAQDPTQNGMARVRAVQAIFEALGWHKGKPTAPVERKLDLETEADLIALLEQVPESMLIEVIEARKQRREIG